MLDVDFGVRIGRTHSSIYMANRMLATLWAASKPRARLFNI